MTTEQRLFTRADDELIVKQSRGEMSMQDLRRSLRANMTSLNRRAAELGVRLLPRYTGNKLGRNPKTFLSTQDNLTPARIINDKLLKRLQQVHGNTFDGSPATSRVIPRLAQEGE